METASIIQKDVWLQSKFTLAQYKMIQADIR